jgi:hypothetical protein
MIKVFSKTEGSEEVLLSLEDNGDGTVDLITVDADGNRDWTLAEISSDGIKMCAGLDDDLGIRVDEGDGCLFVKWEN